MYGVVIDIDFQIPHVLDVFEESDPPRSHRLLYLQQLRDSLQGEHFMKQRQSILCDIEIGRGSWRQFASTGRIADFDQFVYDIVDRQVCEVLYMRRKLEGQYWRLDVMNGMRTRNSHVASSNM